MNTRVHAIKHIIGNQWLVIYYESLPCMCREVRKELHIESREKPQESEIIRFISEKVK